jgi:hypothetical protein
VVDGVVPPVKAAEADAEHTVSVRSSCAAKRTHTQHRTYARCASAKYQGNPCIAQRLDRPNVCIVVGDGGRPLAEMEQ